MKNMKRIYAILIMTLIILSNGYIYAGVTDITGGSGVTINTVVRENYTDFQVTDDITLEKDKDYIIDFAKEDNLSKGLSSLADLEKTVYYKIVDGEKTSLCETENASEAVMKIVGNEAENKAIMTLINLDKNKSYNLDFMYTKYTGSKLTYTGTDYESGTTIVGDPDDIDYSSSGTVTINEIRDDYYSRYFFKCKLNLIAIPTYDIEIEGTYNGLEMEISLNGTRVGTESANVTGTAKGYTTGNTKNKITIRLALGDGNIGSVTINGTNMTLPAETTDRAEFEVVPATKYIIAVTKSQNISNVPETIIDDSDKTTNSSLKDNELAKNETIENNTINPKTGDNVVIYILLSAISITGILTLVIVNSRNNKKERKH